MKKKLQLIKSVTLNGGTMELPKPVKVDTSKLNTAEGVLFEVLRKECEAFTGEKIPVAYKIEDTESVN